MSINDFEQLVSSLAAASCSSNVFNRIIDILETQTSETLATFIADRLASLVAIEHWAWHILSRNIQQWTTDDSHVKLFHAIQSFNMKIVYKHDGISLETKVALLVPTTIEPIDTYIRIAGLWLDTLSYLAHEQPDVVSSTTIIYINEQLSRHFLMTNQYKIYLKELQHTHLPTSIFTAKQSFYINTCSFSLHTYLWSRSPNFPFTGEQIINFVRDEYTTVLLVQSSTIETWTRQLLMCISHILGLVCSACWWGGQKRQHIELIAPSTDPTYAHLFALIRLISYQPFHQSLATHLYSDETLVIDISLIFIFAIVETQDLGCFLNSKTTLSATLLTIAQISPNDHIRICAYGLLIEILTDEQVKELQLKNNIGEFLFDVVEQAWKHPMKRWRKIPIPYLLKGETASDELSSLNRSYSVCRPTMATRFAI
jgi:hypothetical protein